MYFTLADRRKLKRSAFEHAILNPDEWENPSLNQNFEKRGGSRARHSAHTAAKNVSLTTGSDKRKTHPSDLEIKRMLIMKKEEDLRLAGLEKGRRRRRSTEQDSFRNKCRTETNARPQSSFALPPLSASFGCQLALLLASYCDRKWTHEAAINLTASLGDKSGRWETQRHFFPHPRRRKTGL